MGGRKEAWKGPMTSLVVLRVKRYGPANEFPSTARRELSKEVMHG